MTVYVVTLMDFEDGITYVRGVYSNKKKAEGMKRELDKMEWVMANVESFEVE